jgi:hypothetical protein
MPLQNIDSRALACKILQIKELSVKWESPRVVSEAFFVLVPV